jgi:hypothetical protein
VAVLSIARLEVDRSIHVQTRRSLQNVRKEKTRPPVPVLQSCIHLSLLCDLESLCPDFESPSHLKTLSGCFIVRLHQVVSIRNHNRSRYCSSYLQVSTDQAALLCKVQLRLEKRITSVRAKVPKMMLAALKRQSHRLGQSMVNPPTHFL